MKIRELMTMDLVTVGPETPLKEAARKMATNGVSGLPVVSEGRLVGIITEADFVERTSGHHRASLLDMLLDRSDRLRAAACVGEAMTTSVVTIAPNESHADAAQLMRRKRVKRLPVVDEAENLMGIVSRSDILTVFTRPDEAMEQDIRHRILGQVLAIDPDRLSVEVTDGRVTIRGTVQARTEAALIEDLVSTVDGVWSVDTDIRYLVDDTRPANESRPFGTPRSNW